MKLLVKRNFLSDSSWDNTCGSTNSKNIGRLCMRIMMRSYRNSNWKNRIREFEIMYNLERNRINNLHRTIKWTRYNSFLIILFIWIVGDSCDLFLMETQYIKYSIGEMIESLLLSVGEKVKHHNILITTSQKDGLTQLEETINRMRSCDCKNIRLIC